MTGQWPYSPVPRTPRPGERKLNLNVPVSLPGVLVNIHLDLPEQDARAIMNMDRDLARTLGPFFELIKDGLTTFLEREG